MSARPRRRARDDALAAGIAATARAEVVRISTTANIRRNSANITHNTATITMPAPLSATTPLEVVAQAFLDAAVDSAETRRSYRRHLADAQAFLQVDALAELDGAQLAAWRAHLLAQPLSPASQAQALSALRSFLRWSGALGAHRLSSDVLATALKAPRATVRRPYSVLSEPELHALLEAATTPRDRALVALLAGAGLRVSEVVALDVRDVLEDHEGGAALYVRQGKGRRDRTVPIRADVLQLLRAHLAASGRRIGDAGPLFAASDRAAHTRAPRRLTARAAGNVVARCVDGAGIAGKHVSPHTLRHTFALRALRSGGEVVKVSKLLGHASLTTTQRYVDHLATRELRDAVPLLP